MFNFKRARASRSFSTKIKSLDPEATIVITLMAAFGFWSLFSLTTLPTTMSPKLASSPKLLRAAGTEVTKTAQPETTPSAPPSIPTAFPPSNFAGESQPPLNIRVMEPILKGATTIGFFPIDPRTLLSDLFKPSQSLTLILASQSHDYQALSSQALNLRSLCTSSALRCFALLSEPDNFGALRDGYLAHAYFPTFLVGPSILSQLPSQLGLRNNSDPQHVIHSMLFGTRGDLLWAASPLIEDSSQQIYLVTRTSLMLSLNPALLGNPPIATPSSVAGPSGKTQDNLPTASSTKVEKGVTPPGIEEDKKGSAQKPSSDDNARKPKKTEKSDSTTGKRSNNSKEAVTTKIPPAGEDKRLKLSALTYPVYSVKNGAATKLAGWIASQGKPVVLNFWATWCIPCRKELSILSRLSKEYTSVLFIGLVDGDADSRTYHEITQLLEKEQVGFPQYVFPQSKLQIDIVGGRSLPSFAIFDGKGRIIDRFSGTVSEGESYKKFVKTLDSLSKGKK